MPLKITKNETRAATMATLALAFLLLFLHLRASSSFGDSYIASRCGATSVESYGLNLKGLLSGMARVAIESKRSYYATNTSDFGPRREVFYGAYLCLGNIPSTECTSCVLNAIAQLRVQCRTSKMGVIWFDACVVRYSNHCFLGTVVEDDSIYKGSKRRMKTNQKAYLNLAGSLLQDISVSFYTQRDIPVWRTKYFEYWFATLPGSYVKVYTMVQCTPDLTPYNCQMCLQVLTDDIPAMCSGSINCWMMNPSCIARYSSFAFLKTPFTCPSPTPIPDHYKAPTLIRKKSSKSKTIILIARISTIALVILCYVSFRRRKMKRISEETKVEIASVELLQYDFSTIKAATNNFSSANKLGHGGFGAVYKGIGPDGQEIAVKRLASNNLGQGEAEFKNEITLLARLQHKNLVRLYGFCLDKKERILVYEYVPNASLDRILFGSPENGGLDWSKRRQIIGGIVQGLLYLHEHSRLKIIHRDLKPANILLDAEMNPKIADFGLAKLFSANETHEIVSKVAGTCGYMAPEYTRYKKFSVKLDVYSFGILLLEIICGRKNNGFFEEEFVAGLVSLVWKNWRDRTILNVVDPKVALSTSLETEVSRHILIGLLCVQKNAADRPNMSSVIIWLSTDCSLPLPSIPGYISETFQLPNQSSDSDWSTLHSNVSSTENGNSTSMIHPL